MSDERGYPKDNSVLLYRLDEHYDKVRGRRNWGYENHPVIRVLNDINRVALAVSVPVIMTAYARPNIMKRTVKRGKLYLRNHPQIAGIVGSGLASWVVTHTEATFNDVLGYVPRFIREAGQDLADGVSYLTADRASYNVPYFDPQYNRLVRVYNDYREEASRRGILPWSHKTMYNQPLHEGEYIKHTLTTLVNGAAIAITAANSHVVRDMMGLDDNAFEDIYEHEPTIVENGLVLSGLE